MHIIFKVVVRSRVSTSSTDFGNAEAMTKGRQSSNTKSAKDDSVSKRHRTGGTGLNDFFIGVFGLCFLLSVSLNFLHDSEAIPHDHNTAVKRAIEDFKQDMKSKGGPTLDSQKNRPGEDSNTGRRLAELNCEKWGGPEMEAAQEMVYWEDIPSDETFVSPFCQQGKERFMTFEPDGGGWNNIRMAMESVIGLAYAMCRTLVMAPQKRMYLLGKGGKNQRNHFSFVDFFPIEEMAKEHKGLNIISMKEYLETRAMTGKLRNAITGEVEFPPGNRTDWDGIDGKDYDVLRGYLRNVSETATWNPGQCLPAFPSSGDHKDVEVLQKLVESARRSLPGGTPVKVDDPNPLGRLEETLAGRRDLCVYDERMQNLPIIHFQCNHKKKLRMLVHFYAFLFFENWKEDLWMKRFIRDHVHYVDEIQCAAARLVKTIRDHARKRDPNNPNGDFDAFHIRRGDFQFKATRIGADEIYENSKDELTPNSTVFIATDERDKKFFDPLRAHYDLLFLDDFKDELNGVNTNYYGMYRFEFLWLAIKHSSKNLPTLILPKLAERLLFVLRYDRSAGC
mmetsp:Transcript_36468/g.88342  ORF Transcript_36468/g.88342 Transcript_36468/m.88342 type:complete len:562 (-) Transcript_36468:4894-6579(-)